MIDYEIEIKSLLGEDAKANSFRSLILELGAKPSSSNTQLNHYFTGSQYTELARALQPYFSEDVYERYLHILDKGSKFSLRTREIDGVVKLVLKASVDDASSENGIARMEFEESLQLSLDALDQIILSAGFEYQAKWSRLREEYQLDDITICLDKNAGYGWLTEFEVVIKDGADRDEAESNIRSLMKTCGVEELDQERLARMFDYYNKNWREYYGTDNVFTVE